MKTSVLILFLSLTLFSCSKDDDNEKQLSGSYFLVNVECFCGFDPDINFNDFKLNFVKGKNQLILDNPTEDYFYIADSGTYTYSINGDVITVNSMSFNYKIEGDSLILTFVDEPQIADDELVLTYKRN